MLKRSFRRCSYARLVRLIIVVGLWMYLPLEAFDGDAPVGFDNAVLRDCDFFGRSDSGLTPTPSSPSGPPLWRALPASVLGAAALLPPVLPEVPDHQLRRLRASCLCARSRLDESHRFWQEQQASILDATSRPSHGSIGRGEGGFVFITECSHRPYSEERFSDSYCAPCGDKILIL